MIKQPILNQILHSLSKEELVNIIEDAAAEDVVFKNNLILKYSKLDEGQELKQCKKLMKAIVKKYQGRDGFIFYREVFSYANEMRELLDKADHLDNPLTALDIAIMILEEAVESFQYADDSDGEIGALIQDVLEQIMELTARRAELKADEQSKMFDKLLTLSENDVFDGWDEYRIEILSICAEFGETIELREKLRTKLQQSIDNLTGDSSEKFLYGQLLQLLFSLVSEYDSTEAAEQMLNRYIHVTFFRETAIRQALNNGNYDAAIQVAVAGEQQDEQLPGLVMKWKQLRYEAYKELAMKEEQTKLAKELLLDGDFEYYRELESLAEVDKQAFYQELKAELKQCEGWGVQRLFIQLIEEENDLEELLEYVNDHPMYIESYAARLADAYKNEVIAIYKKHILNRAAAASNRKEYKGIVKLIKHYKQFAGQEGMQQMAAELSNTYNNRPAFLDELNKLK